MAVFVLEYKDNCFMIKHGLVHMVLWNFGAQK